MRLKINMKCINRMRTQSKTIVLIMMALKDMRRTSNCDNKRDNETKMSDYKSIWWKQPCWKAIFQQTKWLIQLIDCFLMCFKIVFSLFSDHCVGIFFWCFSSFPTLGTYTQRMNRYIDQWSLFVASFKCKLAVLFQRINNQ